MAYAFSLPAGDVSLHTIAVLVLFLGLALFVACLVEAEICYRKVQRYLARLAAAAKEREEPQGGA